MDDIFEISTALSCSSSCMMQRASTQRYAILSFHAMEIASCIVLGSKAQGRKSNRCLTLAELVWPFRAEPQQYESVQ